VNSGALPAIELPPRHRSMRQRSLVARVAVSMATSGPCSGNSIPGGPAYRRRLRTRPLGSTIPAFELALPAPMTQLNMAQTGRLVICLETSSLGHSQWSVAASYCLTLTPTAIRNVGMSDGTLYLYAAQWLLREEKRCVRFVLEPSGRPLRPQREYRLRSILFHDRDHRIHWNKASGLQEQKR
jgi:hypothetical protein